MQYDRVYRTYDELLIIKADNKSLYFLFTVYWETPMKVVDIYIFFLNYCKKM